ncbi:MAG: hypothetical protein EOO99_01095 [Pedobacter sp.]|nr:MAG: hypothetical protein EOO99_01095 [Pedobacter sp.]
MVFNFGLHFNLDKQAQDERVFNLTRFSLGADFFSRKVFSEGLFLNAESNTYFKRPQIQNSLGVGFGGAISLKER